MLGSNPSARAMAGHQQEHLLLTGAPVPQESQLMFCPQSDKPMQPETYKISKNYEEPRAVCHLAIFTGLGAPLATDQGFRSLRSLHPWLLYLRPVGACRMEDYFFTGLSSYN
jgi:hypothetical protein